MTGPQGKRTAPATGDFGQINTSPWELPLPPRE
jgi:hypothetical protein